MPPLLLGLYWVTGLCFEGFTRMTKFNLLNALGGRYYYDLYFTDMETEAQGGLRDSPEVKLLVSGGIRI